MRRMPERPPEAQVEQEEWERFFEQIGHAGIRRAVSVMARMPSEPRCEVCGSPFAGVGGAFMRVVGKGPSRKNPRWCDLCFERSPNGGATMTVGVLFADVRGSTSLGERMAPEQVVTLLNRFYRDATRVILQHGLVDKLIGDEVMGLYLPPLSPQGRFIDTMVADARAIQESIGYGTDDGAYLDVGIGLDVGPAFVGKVGEAGVTDFTAVGDVVNTAARLQSHAGPGQIVMTAAVADGATVTDACREQLEVKGKSVPVEVCVLQL